MGWFIDRLDETRRMAGERGGVALDVVPCAELYEDLLCKTGVRGVSLALILLELGVLRMVLGEGLGVVGEGTC